VGAVAVSFASCVRIALVVLLTLVVQQALLVHLRVAGAHPDVVFLLAVAAGYVAGPALGPVIGFCSGLASDLLLPTPFGMSALVGAVLAYCVAVVTSSLVRSSLALQFVTGAGGTAAGLCLYAALGAVLGYPKMLELELVPALVVSTPVAAVLAVPAIGLLRWALTDRTAGERAGLRSRSLRSRSW
jgi:rod shape-determining protein MreD